MTPQIRLPAGTDLGSLTERSRGRPVRWWRELILVAGFYAVYDAIRGVIAGSIPRAVPACFFYATLHFIVTPTVLIWSYETRPAAYRNARTVLAIVTASALIGFWRFPTAPPRSLRWLHLLAVVYPVLTVLVALGTANHYLADVLAGAGLWALADFGVRHLARSASTAGQGAIEQASE